MDTFGTRTGCNMERVLGPLRFPSSKRTTQKPSSSAPVWVRAVCVANAAHTHQLKSVCNHEYNVNESTVQHLPNWIAPTVWREHCCERSAWTTAYCGNGQKFRKAHMSNIIILIYNTKQSLWASCLDDSLLWWRTKIQESAHEQHPYIILQYETIKTRRLSLKRQKHAEQQMIRT